MIHWELSKKFKFDPTNKWYMRNSKYVLENEVHQLLSDFEIQTDHLISARRPNLVKVNNKTKKKKKKKKEENLPNCGLCCASRTQNKTERKGKER